MPDSRTLTLATLQQKSACSDQLALFKRLFGDSVEVTEALAAEHARKFDMEWAAVYLLSPKAWAAYRAAMAPAQEAYDAAVTKARTAFAAAKAQAWARSYLNDK